MEFTSSTSLDSIMFSLVFLALEKISKNYVCEIHSLTNYKTLNMLYFDTNIMYTIIPVQSLYFGYCFIHF